MSREITGTIYKFDGQTPWAGARLVFSLLTDTATGIGAAWPVWSRTYYADTDGGVPDGTILDTPVTGSWLYRLKIEENAPLDFYLSQGDGSALSISDIATLAGAAGSEAGTPQIEWVGEIYDGLDNAGAGHVLTANGDGGASWEVGGVSEPSSDGLWARLRSSGVGSWLAATAIGQALFAAVDAAAARSAIGAEVAGSAAAVASDLEAAIAARLSKSGDTATGPIIIDNTSPVAFQVRKADDAGDVFSVDTQGRHVWVGAVTSPVELFEVAGEVTPGTDSFGIRSTFRSALAANDTTYHWSAMLAQIIQNGAYQNGAWLAAMYTYYRQDGSGTQDDVRSVAALNRINDGVANNVHGVYSDIQLNGDAQAGNVYHFRVSPTVKNDTSQITGNEYGLYVGNLTSGTLNYGVYVHENVRSRFGRVDIFGKLTVGSGFALELDDGTNSLPSFTFGNDTNTGIYRKASDNLGIACGGQNAVEIKPLQVGIGTTRGSATPAATLHLDQWLAGGAQPVLLLDQADESEEIFEIISNPGVGNAIELVGSKSLTVTEFIKVTINGNTRYIPAGTIA